MNTGQTLPTNKESLNKLFGRDFATMQKQYKRHVDEYKTFSEPTSLPSTDITAHHLFNVCTYCYPSDKASLEILQKLPPLPQFANTKSKVIDEQKPPSATVERIAVLKEDKENILNKEIEVLRANIKAKNAEISQLNEAHTGEIQAYIQKITQAQQEKDTAHKVAQQRQETITRLQNDIQTLRTGKESADRQLQTVQASQTSIDKTVQTLQTNYKQQMSEMSEAHKLEMSELSAKNAADISDMESRHEKILADTTQTFNDKLTELENSKNTEGVELQERLQFLSEENDSLKSQIEEIERSQNSFIGKMRSKTVTVLGLLCVVIYQGLHSQHFFADRATNKDDLMNIVFSCLAAIAISLAGFKLTLHTNNKAWIWGAAAIDFAIYITPKEMSIANFLAAFAVAASIVAYSHILQKE